MNFPEGGMSLQPGNRAATPKASSVAAVTGGRTHLGTDIAHYRSFFGLVKRLVRFFSRRDDIGQSAAERKASQVGQRLATQKRLWMHHAI